MVDFRFRKVLGLATLFATLWPITPDANACSDIAKIIFYSKADPSHIHISRKEEPAANGPLSDTLCAGDKVAVEKGTHITVKYFTQPPLLVNLEGPAYYPVQSLSTNTITSNVQGMVASISKWFQENPDDYSVNMMSRSSSHNGQSRIRSPLARGESEEFPYELSTDADAIYYFWRGGLSPWRVVITTANDQPVFDEKVERTDIRIPLNSLDRSAKYRLTVYSADGKAFNKAIEFKQPRSGDNAVDPTAKLISLLYLDQTDNWRLQIWSFLKEQPDSQLKKMIMDHIEKDDL